MNLKFLPLVLAVLSLNLDIARAVNEEITFPDEVSVLPVFFVPKGDSQPSEAHQELLMKHLKLAQSRFGELLPGGVTFKISGEKPKVFQGANDFAYYKGQGKGGASDMTGELLTALKMTRYNCPYIFVIVLMNEEDLFAGGGGRPFNGGFNTGGGIVQVNTYALEKVPNFQSNLQRDLGRAMGLPQVGVYRYSMAENPSIMASNSSHHSNGLEYSATPAIFIPEDIRGLSLNQRGLPGLKFDPATMVPPGYKLSPVPIALGIMEIKGHPYGVKITSSSPDSFKTQLRNITQGQRYDVDRFTKASSFDPQIMWHSTTTPDKTITLNIEFPYQVTLDTIGIYSRHSGRYNPANGVKIFLVDPPSGKEKLVIDTDFEGGDDTVKFEPAMSKYWRLELKKQSSDKPTSITMRGLRYFYEDQEYFPPLVPYDWQK